MTAHTEAPPRTGRLRAAWTAAHEPVPGVPRWARIAAHAIPYTVLPSSLWRIAAVTFHVPLIASDGPGASGDLPSWLPLEVYVIILSVISELLAFAAVGLIAGWGEVFPHWIPGLRGRRVPALAAVIPAVLGAVVLTAMWTAAAVLAAAGRTLQGRPLPDTMPLAHHDWRAAVLALSYAPLLLWGPLLAVVTVAYWRRRVARSHESVLPA